MSVIPTEADGLTSSEFVVDIWYYLETHICSRIYAPYPFSLIMSWSHQCLLPGIVVVVDFVVVDDLLVWAVVAIVTSGSSVSSGKWNYDGYQFIATKAWTFATLCTRGNTLRSIDVMVLHTIYYMLSILRFLRKTQIRSWYNFQVNFRFSE
jgi:hypothetical protein